MPGFNTICIDHNMANCRFCAVVPQAAQVPAPPPAMPYYQAQYPAGLPPAPAFHQLPVAPAPAPAPFFSQPQAYLPAPPGPAWSLTDHDLGDMKNDIRALQARQEPKRSGNNNRPGQGARKRQRPDTRLDELEKELKAVKEERDALKTKSDKVDELEKELEAVKEERDALNTNIADAEKAAEVARHEACADIAELNQEVGTLKGQVAALEAEKSSAKSKSGWFW